MPQKWSEKRGRQYDKVRKSARDRGDSAGRAKEIAAHPVNKEWARSGDRVRLAAPPPRTYGRDTGVVSGPEGLIEHPPLRLDLGKQRGVLLVPWMSLSPLPSACWDPKADLHPGPDERLVHRPLVVDLLLRFAGRDRCLPRLLR